MKERLRELAEEAVYVAMYDEGNEDNAKMEKFAELILKACIDNLEFHGEERAMDQLRWLASNKFGIKL